MTNPKDPSQKALTPKQLDRLKAEYKLEGGQIPPWIKAANKNTTRDLKRFNVYQIQEALEQALLIGKHREHLEAMGKRWARIGHEQARVSAKPP